MDCRVSKNTGIFDLNSAYQKMVYNLRVGTMN